MTFVLVPGAGGNGHYWHLVAPLLGPDTISVDLPAGDEDAGLEAYADAIVAAADGASDVTLVAHVTYFVPSIRPSVRHSSGTGACASRRCRRHR